MQVVTGQGTTQTRNHWWWREGWCVGQRAYAFHLTFEHCHELHLLAARLRPAIAAQRTQDVVPDGGLHLTMTQVGFAGDVDDEQLRRVQDAVFDNLGTLTDGVLALDGVMVGDEGVVLNARRDSWLMELSRLQREAVDDVLGPQPWGGVLWPHVSLSYSNGVAPVAPLVDALRAVVPPQPTLVVSRPRVTLMRIHRDARRYEWDVLHQAPWTPTRD